MPTTALAMLLAALLGSQRVAALGTSAFIRRRS